MSRSTSSKRRVRVPLWRPSPWGRCPVSRKVRWRTRKDARQHTRNIVARGGDRKGLNEYKCLDCGAWHVGHSRKEPT